MATTTQAASAVEFVCPLRHALTRHNVGRLLEHWAPTGGLVVIAASFRPASEHTFCTADVGYLSPQRRERAILEDVIDGAPDIVVEVISPTLTMMQLWDREQICLANGAKEFWVANPGLRIVKVTTPDGRTVTYREGDEIPLPIFGSEAKIKVSEIFRY